MILAYDRTTRENLCEQLADSKTGEMKTKGTKTFYYKDIKSINYLIKFVIVKK